MTADRIKEIVAQMTLEEKAAMCSGADFWHTEAVERLGIPASMVSDGPHGLRKQDQEGTIWESMRALKQSVFLQAVARRLLLTGNC